MGNILKKVSAARIFVHDLDRARRFYRDVLELDERAVDPGWAVFKLGDVDIIIETCAADDPETAGLVGRLVAVSFDANGKIDEVYRRLVGRDVMFPQPPDKQEWGGTLAFFLDPDGNMLTLVG